MSRILRIELEHKKFNINFACDPYPRVNVNIYETDNEVDWIARTYFNYETNSPTVPCYESMYLLLEINIDVVGEEKANEIIRRFTNREELEKLIESYFCSTIDAFNTLISMLTEVCPPYSTVGIRVHKMYDTGGDYPSGELEFEYIG